MSDKEIILEIQADYEEKYFAGLLIKTNKQEIKCLIKLGRHCCEDYGYLTTNDKAEDFVGAELLSIKQTDDKLNAIDTQIGKTTEMRALFITFETSVGDLQFTAYNEHNGYYGHEVKITSNQLDIDEVI